MAEHAVSRRTSEARYVLGLYASGLASTDTHHRDLIAAVLADRLSDEA